jgi:hypothetical protein
MPDAEAADSPKARRVRIWSERAKAHVYADRSHALFQRPDASAATTRKEGSRTTAHSNVPLKSASAARGPRLNA